MLVVLVPREAGGQSAGLDFLCPSPKRMGQVVDDIRDKAYPKSHSNGQRRILAGVTVNALWESFQDVDTFNCHHLLGGGSYHDSYRG